MSFDYNIQITQTAGANQCVNSIELERWEKLSSNAFLKKLISECEEFGKISNPLYRKGYESDIPSMDFSIVIKELLIKRDYDTLIVFLESLYNAYYNSVCYNPYKFDYELKRYAIRLLSKFHVKIPQNAYEEDINLFILKHKDLLDGLLSYTEIESIERYCKHPEYIPSEALIKMANDDYDIYVRTNDDMFYWELKTLFALYQKIHSFESRYSWINSNEAILIYYSLGFYNLALTDKWVKLKDRLLYLDKWNKEINHYVEVDYNTNFDHIQEKHINKSCTDFLQKIKQLGLVERVFFLYDFANTIGYELWDGKCSYNTKKWGINEKLCIEKLLELNLLCPSDEIDLLSETLSKEEFLAFSSQINVPIKKSWTKRKIYDAIINTEQGKSLLIDEVKKRGFLKLNPIYEQDMDYTLQQIEYNKKILQLLCMI